MSTATPTPTDLTDERLQGRTGLSGYIRTWRDKASAGELGVLPVLVGLLIITIIFQILNPVFLSADNLVNLALESCAVGIIALGIVCVLLVGEIDLSVGSTSGVASAIVAVLFVNNGFPLMVAILAAIVAGTIIGFVYGFLRTRLGMPSFVATLAGLLGYLGLQLWLLGNEGSINVPFDSALVRFAQISFVPKPLAYVLAIAAAAGILLTGLERSRKRQKAGLSHDSLQKISIQAGLALLVFVGVVWYLNQSRGIGWMVVLFVGLVIVMNYLLVRTKWGRSMFAVGGNVEAARRSGINVRRIYVSAFMICSTLAAVGGILAAGRLGSANQSTGTGDVNLNAIAAAVIGGTSLFGGRGSAYAALLGIIVIQAISSGLTLLNLSSSYRFMITGIVLALAVGVDALARRSRSAHGRG